MGLDDNAVTTCITTALGSKVPILCAPGMHAPMMCHPAVRRNLETVSEMGIRILSSSLSEGKQKMMGTEEMVAEVLRALSSGLLNGRKVLITGGPTREYLDPARCLTNPSSGLTACLLAGEAHRLGAEVELIYGPGSVPPPAWVPVRRVETGEQMLEAVQEAVELSEPDIVVCAAAVSDFAPVHASEEKRATTLGEFELLLKPTPKIIDWIRRHVPQALLVAFKAASSRNDEQLLAAIQPYLAESRADLVVGNSVMEEGQGFESSTNRYLICTKDGEPVVLEKQSKARLSVLLWESIARFHRSRARS
jgi:phosphopantothenoylcysteine decarboxylase/phosphopantothenate--cysteine ligase